MCTGLMLKAKDGSVIHGRTLEFVIEVEPSIAFVPRNQQFISSTPTGPGLQYQSKFAAVGAFSFQDVKLADGLNEKGLAAAIFYFPSFCKYMPVTAQNQNKALSSIEFVHWILTQFSTVDEVRTAIYNNEVVVTPTRMAEWGAEELPFHYIVYDIAGASIVIEPIEGKLVIHDNHIGVITNAPTFDWHMTNLRNYIALNPQGVQQRTIDQTIFKQIGQGNGMLGLPGDFTPTSRFIRAAIFSAAAIRPETSQAGVQQLFHILNNFDIPIGIAREEKNGRTMYDYTMFTCVRDPKNLCYYYKSYYDQTIRSIDLKKFDWDEKKIKTFKLSPEPEIIDISNRLD